MPALPSRTRNDVVGPGSLVGRYRLVKELGRGAMGLVFLADDTVLKQQLCVKVLDPRLVNNPEALERFHREIVLARRIAHRSVCRLHDLHQEGSLHFITMEYVEGVPLRELLVGDRPLLAVGRVTTIVRNICDALAAAHDVNVIHRDLKPANVMVCPGDEINLLDFGIATADDLRSSLTLPGVAIGTRNYIAPEVWAGRPATAKSDQFSLGVLFYNCLTKQRPFATDKDVVEAMKVPPRPPSSLRADVPKALDDVVLRALAFSPSDRYFDLRKLAAAIADVEKREGLRGLPGHGFDPNERSDPSNPNAAAQVITAPRGVSTSSAPTVPPGAMAAGPVTPSPGVGVDATLPPASTRAARIGADDALTIPPATPAATKQPPITGTTTPARVLPPTLVLTPSRGHDASAPDALPPTNALTPVGVPMPPDTLPDRSEPTGLSGTSSTDPLLPRPSLVPRVLGGLVGVAIAVVIALVALRNDDEKPNAPVNAASSAAFGESVRQATQPALLSRAPDEDVVRANGDGNGDDDRAAVPVIAETIVGEPARGEATEANATNVNATSLNATNVNANASANANASNNGSNASSANGNASATAARDKRERERAAERERVMERERAAELERADRERAERERASETKNDDGKRYADARAATQRTMADRGVAAGDDTELDGLRNKASGEAKAKRFAEAIELEGDARRRAEAVVVDKAFVKRKLVRFNTRFDELKDASARARLESVSTDVLTAMREGRYEDANRALNAAFAAMR